MTDKIFQKSASLDAESVPHKGVLRPMDFAEGFTFSRHPASQELEPYVDYIWVIRWDLPDGAARTSPAILPNPQINLYFDETGAGVQGVFKTNKTYQGQGKSGVAGVTFKPGGFYAFWPHSAAVLTNKSVALHTILPHAPQLLTDELLAGGDSEIARQLTLFLQGLQPKPHKSIQLVQDILAAIQQDESPQTVQDIAARFAKSERTLQHLFQTHIGVGIKWVLMRNRLLAAAEQARTQPDPDWAAIALDLGYASQAHFITDFTRTIGVQPGKYLQHIR